MKNPTQPDSPDVKKRKSGKAGKASLKDLMESGGALEGFNWPENLSESEILIKRDGSWHHQGGLIERLKLCQLFATILQRDEDGEYWLVTPVERARVTVEDAPFLAVEMKTDGTGRDQVLLFRTSLDHWVTADADHPIRLDVDLDTQEPSPYIMFRDGLEALINRAVFYDLINLAEEREENGQTSLGLWSSGTFFPLGSFE